MYALIWKRWTISWNRPHFYQDVAYGNKILDSGEKIQMPNVVRTLARSTKINQYFEFAKTSNWNP